MKVILTAALITIASPAISGSGCCKMCHGGYSCWEIPDPIDPGVPPFPFNKPENSSASLYTERMAASKQDYEYLKEYYREVMYKDYSDDEIVTK